MHCRKKICWTCLFQESIPALHVLQRHSTHEEIRESVRVKSKGEILNWDLQSSSNIVSVEVGVANQWLIRMIFRRKLFVPKICCPPSIQATRACRSEVSARFLGRPAFQLSMFTKMHCRKKICWTCLFRESIPALLFFKDIQLMKRSESP